MKVMIAAGGTGGHIYPGIAIAEELMERDAGNRILFIGSREGLEADLIRREGFKVKLIHARALLRKISYKAVTAPFVSFWGFFEALAIIRSFRPDYLIVTGGYVSFPVIAAAIILGVPFLLQEQNVLPGFSNRFWHRFAKQVALSFDQSLKYMKGTVTGNPVRKRILSANPVKHDRKTVTMIGGSQGARSINNALIGQIEKLKGVEINHIIGKRDFALVKDKIDRERCPFYHPIEYMYNMEDLLARTDLAVSRAGATAISEILAMGLPAILIPFPYSAEGHQDLNAEAVQKAGAGYVIPDRELARLSDTILSILNDENRLKSMGLAAKKIAKRDASRKIADMIYAEY